MRILNQGRGAYEDGKHRINDNPYPKGSTERIEFNKGYLMAYNEEYKESPPDDKPNNSHIHPEPQNNIFKGCTLEEILELEAEVRKENDTIEYNADEWE